MYIITCLLEDTEEICPILSFINITNFTSKMKLSQFLISDNYYMVFQVKDFIVNWDANAKHVGF